MNEPHIDFTGHLAFDPVVKFTPNGTSVVDLRVATTRRFKVGEEWQDGDTLWFDVACWKQLGENVAESVQEGRQGDRQRAGCCSARWAREDGSTGSTLVVDATHVGLDLSRSAAVVKRPIREGSAADALRDRWDNGPSTSDRQVPAAEDVAQEIAA